MVAHTYNSSSREGAEGQSGLQSEIQDSLSYSVLKSKTLPKFKKIKNKKLWHPIKIYP